MTRSLEEFRETPLPPAAPRLAAKAGYRAWPIDTAHAAYTEPLTDAVGTLAGRNFYSRTDNPPYHGRIPGSTDRILVRTGVLERLVAANARLLPAGLELYLYDGWRPMAVQHHIRSAWLPEYLKRLDPRMTDVEITERIDRYWAHGPAHDAEVDPLSPPPHATGAAVDLTIRSIGGEPLWMGTLFDDVSSRAHAAAFEEARDPDSFSDAEALCNRRLLYWLMREAGFQGNPTEWWHFSYGDQMWAKLESAETGADVAARYSNIVAE